MSEDEGETISEYVVDTTSKYVFLDSNVYHAHSFDVGSATFNALHSLCERDEIRLIVTDVIRGEVRSGIQEQVDIAAEILSSKHRQLRILGISAHLSTGETLQLNRSGVGDAIAAALDNYWTNCKAINLDSSNVYVPSLLQAYFSRQPPFGAGKKKHEFPDAIDVSLLKEHCRKSFSKIHVVTSDPDLITCCQADDALLHAPSLARLLSAFTDRKVTDRIASAISKSQRRIYERLIDNIDDHIFEVDAYDYDILNSSFNDENLDSLNVLQVDGNYFTAELGYSMHLELEIEYRTWDEPTLEEEFQSPRYRRASVSRRLDLWAEISGVWSPFEEEVEIERVVHSFPQSVSIRLGSHGVAAASSMGFKRGDRVFHIKFGYGSVRGVEDDKLTVSFDKAGERKVLDSFVEKQ